MGKDTDGRQTTDRRPSVRRLCSVCAQSSLRLVRLGVNAWRLGVSAWGSAPGGQALTIDNLRAYLAPHFRIQLVGVRDVPGELPPPSPVETLRLDATNVPYSARGVDIGVRPQR